MIATLKTFISLHNIEKMLRKNGRGKNRWGKNRRGKDLAGKKPRGKNHGEKTGGESTGHLVFYPHYLVYY